MAGKIGSRKTVKEAPTTSEVKNPEIFQESDGEGKPQATPKPATKGARVNKGTKEGDRTRKIGKGAAGSRVSNKKATEKEATESNNHTKDEKGSENEQKTASNESAEAPKRGKGRKAAEKPKEEPTKRAEVQVDEADMLPIDEILPECDLQFEEEEEVMSDFPEEMMGEIEPEIRDEPVFEIDCDLKVPEGEAALSADDQASSDEVGEKPKETSRAKKIKKETTKKEPKGKEPRNFLDENGQFKARFREFEVIVRNCPFELTEAELREHFAVAPKLKSVKMCFRGEGRFSGSAYLKLANEESMDAALALNGSKLLGRTIYVEKTQATIDSEMDGPKKAEDKTGNATVAPKSLGIFVANIGDATEDDFREFFSTFGTVTSVRLVGNLDQPHRRFAFVDFADAAAAEAALKAEGSKLKDRAIRVRPAYKKDAPKSYQTPTAPTDLQSKNAQVPTPEQKVTSAGDKIVPEVPTQTTLSGLPSEPSPQNDPQSQEKMEAGVDSQIGLVENPISAEEAS